MARAASGRVARDVARVPGGKAGAAVDRSARAFVRESVKIEVSAAVAFEAALAGPIDKVERLIRTRAKDDPQALLDAATFAKVRAWHSEAVAEAVDGWAWWHWQILVESTRKVMAEMRWAEKASAAGYAGISDEIEGRVVVEALALHVFATERMQGMAAAAHEDLVTGLRRQVMLAKEAEEGADMLVARVLSREPVRAHGITGRGVWWRTAYPLGAALTTSSVQASNSLRTRAMERWNATAGDR